MSVQNETLMAYVDGELTAEESARVEAEIAARPELQAYVKRQRALRRGLRDAFGTILDAPLPERLLTAAARPPSRRWRMARALSSLVARRTLTWISIPAAAALACGVVIGVLVRVPNSADIAIGRDGLVARAALSTALTDQLAAQSPRTARAQIGISFRDGKGRYCRTFQTDSPAPLAGVACHQGGAWHIAVLAPIPKEAGAGATFQLAGSAMPDAVRSAVRDMISGVPLDAAGEDRARAQGWNIR
jgi:hypothetical protein